MRAPVLAADFLDLIVGIALANVDVIGEFWKLLSQRMQCGTPLGVALNEDVAVEARLVLECDSCRSVEQFLRLLLGEIRENGSLCRRLAGRLTARLAVATAGERIDIALLECVFRGRLVLQRRRVAGQVAFEDLELRRCPVTAKLMRFATRCH